MGTNSRKSNVVALLVFIAFVITATLGTTSLYFGSSKIGVLYQGSLGALIDGGAR
ncbi:MAG: hypothetical protein ACO1OB_26735 [Archangium sp.]